MNAVIARERQKLADLRRIDTSLSAFKSRLTPGQLAARVDKDFDPFCVAEITGSMAIAATDAIGDDHVDTIPATSPTMRRFTRASKTPAATAASYTGARPRYQRTILHPPMGTSGSAARS